MSIKKSKTKKTLTVTISKLSEKFKKFPLYQERLDKANEILRKVGLPKTR